QPAISGSLRDDPNGGKVLMRETLLEELPINLTPGDMLTLRDEDSTRLVLAFTGLARRTGLSIRETYAYFGRHRINVVFLADNSQVMYLNGVDSLGGTFEQTLEKLRTLIGEWGITDLLTFGNSA